MKIYCKDKEHFFHSKTLGGHMPPVSPSSYGFRNDYLWLVGEKIFGLLRLCNVIILDQNNITKYVQKLKCFQTEAQI